MASPSPVPPTRPAAKGSNKRSWRSAGMPGPLSLTRSATGLSIPAAPGSSFAAAWPVRTVTAAREPAACTALSTRFETTRCSRSSSPSIGVATPSSVIFTPAPQSGCWRTSRIAASATWRRSVGRHSVTRTREKSRNSDSSRESRSLSRTIRFARNFSSGLARDEKFLANLIVRESDRLSRLLSEFLDFSRVRVTECRPTDLRQVAEAAIRLVRQHPDCGAGVKITLEGVATPMEGDEDLLHRVVSNLVLNAVQAAGSRAAVTVRTGRAAANELPGAAGIDNPVALRVSDNGPGIPSGPQDRLFEPFAAGRVGGTGLGLAIVQRAVEAHRGLVLVDTKTGGGTTFTVYFPAARRKEEAA